jgi:hypothetical protein
MNLDLLSLLTEGLLSANPGPLPLLPDKVELRTQLTDQPQQWRTLIVGYIEGLVAPRYRALPGTAVRGAPGSPAQPWDSTPRILQALRPAQALGAWARPATNALALAKVLHPDYMLRRLDGPDDAASGFNLLGQYLSSHSLPAAATASKVAAAQAMRWLMALDAFLVRWSAAISTAAATNTSIAEVLALYRTEGGLIAPLSLAHVEQRRPVSNQLADIHLTEPMKSRILPTMKSGLWSDPADKSFPVPAAWPPSAAHKAAFETLAKRIALMNWMLVIGGLDFVSQRIASPPTLESLREVVTDFMAGNRFGHGGAFDPAAQELAYEALLTDFTVLWPADRGGRVAVVPKTPERLVAFVLTESVLFFGLDKGHGQGPFIEPPADLRYLAYNLQHARSDAFPELDRFIHLLASAAVAANQQASATFAPLKGVLAPLGLRAELAKDPQNGPDQADEHVEEFEKLSTPPDAFVDDPAHMALLADFVLRAEHGHWNAFEKNRGNLARYRTLLAFYSALLA